MDPDQALKEIEDLAKEILRTADAEANPDGERLYLLAEAGEELAEKILSFLAWERVGAARLFSTH